MPPEQGGVLVILVRGVGAVPIILIGGEAAEHEVAQVMLGYDPRGPSFVQGHRVGPS